MAIEQPQDNQVNYLLSDFNTRLRDIEERNRVVKERVLLLGQNLISSRDDIDSQMEQLKKDSNQFKRDLDRIKSMVENILQETDKFAKRDELALIERMLKDFQPLEFMRMKDVEEMINQKLGIKKTESNTEEDAGKNIKSGKTSKKEEMKY